MPLCPATLARNPESAACRVPSLPGGPNFTSTAALPPDYTDPPVPSPILIARPNFTTTSPAPTTFSSASAKMLRTCCPISPPLVTIFYGSRQIGPGQLGPFSSLTSVYPQWHTIKPNGPCIIPHTTLPKNNMSQPTHISRRPC